MYDPILTYDAEPLLSSRDAHINLVGIHDEAKLLPEPCYGWPRFNVSFGTRTHRG